MIKLEYVSLSQAWCPDSSTVNSFDGGYRACLIHGAARLVRLLSHAGLAPEGFFKDANREDGEFWFAETDLMAIKSAALADLRSQGGYDPSRNRDRLRMYLRHQFRHLLAIRRDWTPNFDYVAQLSIPHDRSITALVGKIRKQPVYSEDFPGEEAARTKNIELPGGLTQYVIKFDFPANRELRNCIRGPFGF